MAWVLHVVYGRGHNDKFQRRRLSGGSGFLRVIWIARQWHYVGAWCSIGFDPLLWTYGFSLPRLLPPYCFQSFVERIRLKIDGSIPSAYPLSMTDRLIPATKTVWFAWNSPRVCLSPNSNPRETSWLYKPTYLKVVCVPPVKKHTMIVVTWISLRCLY